jgi:excisionase family DNA binding protein
MRFNASRASRNLQKLNYMTDVTISYFRHFEITKEPQAAAILTLAEAVTDVRNRCELDSPSWMTVDQAAEKLDVSASTIKNMCKSGKLPHTRCGNGRGTLRIKPADLDKIKSASDAKKPFQATLAMLRNA